MQGGHSCAAWQAEPPPDGYSDAPSVQIPLFWGEGTQVMQPGNHSVFSPETLSQASNFAQFAAIDVESVMVELAVTDVAASWTSSAGYVVRRRASIQTRNSIKHLNEGLIRVVVAQE